MWNLAEPGSRFRAAAPNHPEALLEEPRAFQAVGEKHLGQLFFFFVLLPRGYVVWKPITKTKSEN